jgi:hypothetical protein
MQLVTRCASADEFIERFARFTSETDVVVPALPDVQVGTTGRFVIRLHDQSEIMAGRCEVTEVKPLATAPGAPARALMRLRLIEMDARSRGVHLRLIEYRAAASKPASSTPAPTPPATPPKLSIVRTPPPVVVPRAAPPPAAAVTPPPVVPRAAPPPTTAPAPGMTAPPPTAALQPPPLSPSTLQVMTVPTRPITRTAPPPMHTLLRAPAAVAPAPAPLPGLPATVIPAPLPGLPATVIPAPLPVAPVAVVAAPLLVAPAAASAAAAAAFAETETTEVARPRPETRVPGAALTLPANPLSDLDAADLGSFIDFQLLETESADPVAGNVTEKVRADAQPRPARTPRAESRAARAQYVARRVGPYAACVVAGLVLGLALRSGPKASPVAAAAPAVPAPTVAPPPEAAPPVAPAPTAAVRTAPPARCVARVTTTPRGAAVTWGGVALGLTPLERAVPCGQAVVTVRHDRYADVTRTLTAESGKSALLSERLSRPPARLQVTSSPPRAVIKLNKRPIGAAPRRIGTLRFETVRIDASLPGHQPWTKTLYLREAETSVDVKLVPIPKPNARRAAAPAAPARGSKPPAPPAR